MEEATSKMNKAKRDAALAAQLWQPENLKGGNLKQYQLEGLRWLTTLYENGLSGILADEMGLGKTIQVISLIAYLKTKKVKGPFIVAAPLATLPNWMNEFRKWLPYVEGLPDEQNGVKTLLYHGSKAERALLRENFMSHDKVSRNDFPLIVTSYEICILDRRYLEKYKWQYLVVDEGQRVKNRNCRLIRELKALNTQNRLLLSGTPIQNTLDELWSLLNFVNPQIFDNLEVFQSWFGFRGLGKETKEEDVLAQEKENAIVTKLHEILRPFLLRRLKKDVLIDMPPKTEIVVYTPMSLLQKDYYDLTQKGELRDRLLEMGLAGDAQNISQINENMNLRKVCNHPFLFGEPKSEDGQNIGDVNPEIIVAASGKFVILDIILKKLKAQGHKVLIFSQMTALLDILEDYLRNREWRYCRIDGNVKIGERQQSMDAFNKEEDIFAFMLSTRAGGLGINLQAADTVIIFDSDWNPHQDAQAQDRCHRIGQTRPVVVYRLLTIGSVEIDMMEKQVSKKKLERMCVSGGNFARPGKRTGNTKITVDDLRNLLSDDVANLSGRGTADNKYEGIGETELEMIMDRQRLFGDWKADGFSTLASGVNSTKDPVPPEGQYYDIITASQQDSGGGLLGSMS